MHIQNIKYESIKIYILSSMKFFDTFIIHNNNLCGGYLGVKALPMPKQGCVLDNIDIDRELIPEFWSHEMV